MHNRSLPEPYAWMTTGDVAQYLGLSTEMVRELVRTEALSCEYSVHGQRSFRPGEVRRYALARLEKRLPARKAVLATLRPRMIRLVEPRQSRLRVVRVAERRRKVI